MLFARDDFLFGSLTIEPVAGRPHWKYHGRCNWRPRYGQVLLVAGSGASSQDEDDQSGLLSV